MINCIWTENRWVFSSDFSCSLGRYKSIYLYIWTEINEFAFWCLKALSARLWGKGWVANLWKEAQGVSPPWCWCHCVVFSTMNLGWSLWPIKQERIISEVRTLFSYALSSCIIHSGRSWIPCWIFKQLCGAPYVEQNYDFLPTATTNFPTMQLVHLELEALGNATPRRHLGEHPEKTKPQLPSQTIP